MNVSEIINIAIVTITLFAVRSLLYYTYRTTCSTPILLWVLYLLMNKCCVPNLVVLVLSIVIINAISKGEALLLHGYPLSCCW